MEKDGATRSRRRRACVALVYRRTLIGNPTSIKDLIDGGLARLFASKIASELVLTSEECGKKPDQSAQVEIGTPRCTRASRGCSR